MKVSRQIEDKIRCELHSLKKLTTLANTISDYEKANEVRRNKNVTYDKITFLKNLNKALKKERER